MSFSSDKPALENQLPLDIELSNEPKKLRDELNSLYQRIATAVNSKEGGLYVPLEKTTSQQYFDRNNPQKYKNVYRQVVDFGALPNTTSKNVPHNISGWNSQYRLTCMYGTSTNPTTNRDLPIPNDGIFIENTQENVIITTTSDRSSYTETTIVIEYTKAG